MVRRISGFDPPLDLHQRRHRVLVVNEQVVDGPSCRRTGRLGDSLLAGNENPAKGSVRPHLSSVGQLGLIGDEGLEFVLLREALSFERLKPSLLIPGVDAFGHVCAPSRPCDSGASSV